MHGPIYALAPARHGLFDINTQRVYMFHRRLVLAPTFRPWCWNWACMLVLISKWSTVGQDFEIGIGIMMSFSAILTIQLSSLILRAHFGNWQEIIFLTSHYPSTKHFYISTQLCHSYYLIRSNKSRKYPPHAFYMRYGKSLFLRLRDRDLIRC